MNMRRLIVIFASALLNVTAFAHVKADSTGTAPADSLVCVKAYDDGLRIEMAGIGITLVPGEGGAKADFKWSKPERRILSTTLVTPMDIGFNVLTGTDYKGQWEDNGDFLDMRGGKSIRFAFDIAGLTVNMDRASRWVFNTAARFTVDNYRFLDNSVTLSRGEDGTLMPAATPAGTKKSKVAVTYMGIPIRISFTPYKELTITAEASANVLLKAHSKYAFPKVKENLPGFNPFRIGVGGAIDYNGFGVYCDYSLTPLFKSGTGSGARTLSIGFRFGF